MFKSDPRRATILLVVQIAREPFVIQYDADKLVSGHVDLRSGHNSALQPYVDEILRFQDDKRPQIKTLTLKVQHPVPIWGLPPQNSALELGSVSSYPRFVDLVKATAVHIVFDYKFLSQEHQGPFKAFSKASRELTGYPVKQFLCGQGLREASLTALSPVDDVEAPPAYVKPGKRLREGQCNVRHYYSSDLALCAATSTPSSPPQKRSTLQSPTRSNKSDVTAPDSPTTAEAISAAFLHKAAIVTIPCEQLPAHLQKDLVQSPFHPSTPDSDLSKLHAALKSPGSSLPSSPQGPPLLTPWGQLLVSQLRTLLANDFQREQTRQFKRFEKLLERLSYAAEDARAHETAEVEEYLEDHKLDLRITKDDCYDELLADIDALHAKWRQECLDLQDNLDEMFENTFGKMCDRIESIKRFELKRMVATEVKKHGRRWRGVKRGIDKRVVKSDQKLLGRKREVEWEDC